jgi:chaperonin GroES
MKIVPRGDKIIVKRIEPKKVTKGGIHLPDTHKDERDSTLGVVIEVGPGRAAKKDDCLPFESPSLWCVPHGIKVGDVVLFGKYSGWKVRMPNEEQYVGLKEDEVLAVIEGVKVEKDEDGSLRLVD